VTEGPLVEECEPLADDLDTEWDRDDRPWDPPLGAFAAAEATVIEATSPKTTEPSSTRWLTTTQPNLHKRPDMAFPPFVSSFDLRPISLGNIMMPIPYRLWSTARSRFAETP
jgi:hypothetical protein